MKKRKSKDTEWSLVASAMEKYLLTHANTRLEEQITTQEQSKMSYSAESLTQHKQVADNSKYTKGSGQ